MIISTNSNFTNYELEQKEIEPGFSIDFTCITGTLRFQITFKIQRVNNYAPEFFNSTYEIKIPTPLPRGFDVTFYLRDAQLSALDNDLYNNDITFEIEGTDLFYVDFDVDRSALKPIHTAKLLSNQIIFTIDEGGLSFTLRAFDTFSDNPKNNFVSILILQDPSSSFEEPAHFDMSFYQGIFNESYRQVELSLITLNAYTVNTTFSLNGAVHFRISSGSVNEVTLEAIPSSLTEDIMSESFYLFSVDAFEHGVKMASTNVMIETRASEMPKFEKNHYTAILTSNRSFIVEEEISVTGNNLDIALNNALFSASITNNIVTVIFVGPLMPEGNFVTIVMSIMDRDTNKQSEALLIVSIVETYEAKLEFSSQLYEGRISKDSQLSHAPITLNNDTFSITIGGIDSQYFTASQNGQTIFLSLQSGTQIPSNVSYLHFTLIATSAGFQDAIATVIIGIERENTVEVEGDQPYFETGSYFFRTIPNEIGAVGRIYARVDDGSTLSYALLIDDISVASKISIDDTGILSILENIPPGFYNMTATAENTIKQASTQITIHVIERVCDTELVTTVEKTLAVKHLAENGIYNEIMSSKISDCEYEILEVVPSSLRCNYLILIN